MQPLRLSPPRRTHTTSRRAKPAQPVSWSFSTASRFTSRTTFETNGDEAIQLPLPLEMWRGKTCRKTRGDGQMDRLHAVKRTYSPASAYSQFKSAYFSPVR